MNNLRIEADAIARISEQLAPMCDGDEELLHDMLVGETNIDHLVRRVHEQVMRDGELLVGIKERQDDLAGRKQRIANRQSAMKAAIGKLLRAGRLNKLELPEVTYSVRDGKPALRVVDPEAVPEGFQRVKREPDKTAINEHFADASDLPNWLVREPAVDVVTGRVK